MDAKHAIPLKQDDIFKLCKQAGLKPVTYPSSPEPDAQGLLPADPVIKVCIARSIISGRVQAGLTQSALAKEADISVSTLRRVEKARVSISDPVAEKIEKALQKHHIYI